MRKDTTLGGPVVRKPARRTHTPDRKPTSRRNRTAEGRSRGTFPSRQLSSARSRPGSNTSRGHRTLEIAGILSFALLAILIGTEVYQGTASFGYLWLLPILAVVAYLAADLASGFVHFLLDNFGSEKTPLIGPNFIKPFRDHHTDPLGIVRHDFVDTNGNNSLASVPPMLVVWLFVSIGTTLWGYLFGAFFLLLCLGVFMTNQFHKWAHMDTPLAGCPGCRGAG